MTVNENTIKGKWLEMRGEVQKAWGKLTNDELDKTAGDMKAISGLIQQKYGQTQDSQTKKLTDIFERYETKKDHKVDEIKKVLKS